MAVSLYNKLPHHIAVRAKKYRLPKFYEDRWRSDLIGALDTLTIINTIEGPEFWQKVKYECQNKGMMNPDTFELVILDVLKEWENETFDYRVLERLLPAFPRHFMKQKMLRLRALGKIKYNGKKYEVLNG